MATSIAFLAVSQAHQYLHWLPVALRLAGEPGVEVTVLGSSRAGLNLIQSYDVHQTLRLKYLWTPSFQRDTLFTPPRRRAALLLHNRAIRRFPTVITTETTSSLLKNVPGFRSQLILLKHGAGDREGSYNPKHSAFDLILVNGAKHKAALVDRRLVHPDRCIVAGNAKMELTPRPIELFATGKPLALYNPHFDPVVSSWFRHGHDIIAAMERVPDWDFVVAPHVKLRNGPEMQSAAPNIHIDRGSVSSIDRSYTQASDVYIGDVSSQIYEFVSRPRPCIFLNLDRIEWESDPVFAHWKLGQVIESADQLGPALARAQALQPRFEALQRTMSAYSIESSASPASERQARAILEHVRKTQANR